MASQSRNQSRNRPKIAGTAFCLFCLSLFLTAYSARNPWTTQIGASFGSILMRPLQVLYYGGSSNVSDIWDGYFALVGVRKENERLKERMVTLEAENSKLIELESENKRLSDLLGVVKEIGVPGIAARVIGHDPSNWIQVLTVDIGEDRGIHTGMPVLADTGVVGQVVGVGRASARVLLLTDHSSGIDAIIQGGRARGVVQGNGSTCELDFVPVDEEVKIGDRVITSGMDGIYPKGLLIGIVTAVENGKKESGMFQSITVKPAVSSSRLESVFIAKSESDLHLMDVQSIKTGALGAQKGGKGKK